LAHEGETVNESKTTTLSAEGDATRWPVPESEKAIHHRLVAVLPLAKANRSGDGRQIGVELKFPLVREDGRAPGPAVLPALWDHLCSLGWQVVRDEVSGQPIGARKATGSGYTVASCETGYCKPEFSLAPVSDLMDLETAIRRLRGELAPYAESHRVHLLGYGIQPVTAPSRQLLMAKSRAHVWDKVFRSNRIIPPALGHDLHLFTLNAASHVHVSVSREEAAPLLNVLGGFAGPQIALTANSRIWRGQVDPVYRCVAEKFWDWWVPEEGRAGVPQEPIADLADYARMMAGFRPVFVRRGNGPLLIGSYTTFGDYYAQKQAMGVSLDGQESAITPEPADIDLHCTSCWHPARITRYGTVENRPNDQQPPEALPCVAALTLGLTEALAESQEELNGIEWQQLRAARESACRLALRGTVGSRSMASLAERLLELARLGLTRRDLGEERFLDPLAKRLKSLRCPSDDAVEFFRQGGAERLVEAQTFV
jgi:gamma-glutamylcysteine synthetase